MGVTSFAHGTLSTSDTSEHFFDVNVTGLFQFYVDPFNMTTGDVIEFRTYCMVLAGGTARVVDKVTLSGVQQTDGMIEIGAPLLNPLTDATALRFSIKKTAGGTRDIYYDVRQGG